MENTLFVEDRAELVALARKRLELLDQQEKLDAGSQIRYKEYIGFLHANNAYLYYPSEKLAELSAVPLNMDTLEMLGDYSRLFSVFKNQKQNRLSDLFTVDRMTFKSWARTSESKWRLLMDLRQAVVARWEELHDYGESCFVEKTFPVLEESKEYSRAEQLDLALSQYLAALSKYATYFPRMQEIAERLTLIFQKGMTNEQVLKNIKVTRERLRQFKERYISQLVTGCLEDVPHLHIHDALLQSVRDFEQSLPYYKSVDTVNSYFGCEDYMQTCIPLLLRLKKLYEVDNSNSYVYFDQPYLIPEEDSVEDIKKYVTALIKVLGNSPKAEIRPVNLATLMDELFEYDENFPFDENIVRDLLMQHTWIEILDEEGEKKIQLGYIHLYDYQKIARIIYELKSANFESIRQADRERATDGHYLKKIKENCMVARNNYKWACTSGVEGSFVYEESGVAPMALMNVIKNFACDCQIFTYTEITAYLRSLNYVGDFNENSVKCYILRDCVSSIDDPNFYCLTSAVEDYPHHRWRSRNRFGIRHWILSTVVKKLQQTDGHRIAAEEMNALLREESEEAKVELDMESPITYLFNKSEVCELVQREDKKLVLTERGLSMTEDELEYFGVKAQRPEAYDEVAKVILQCLKSSKNHEVMMKTLKKKCHTILEGKSSTLFYSIVNKHLPFRVERVKRKDVLFLRLLDDPSV